MTQTMRMKTISSRCVSLKKCDDGSGYEYVDVQPGIVKSAWEEAEILINMQINELRNQNRHNDVRDVLKAALLMGGYEL